MFLVSACSCLCAIYWSQVFSGEWRCSWSSADRRCSNYIWVINNLIAYWNASYIRDLTVASFISVSYESFGDTCQIRAWFEELYIQICNIRNTKNEDINEWSFSISQPRCFSLISNCSFEFHSRKYFSIYWCSHQQVWYWQFLFCLGLNFGNMHHSALNKILKYKYSQVFLYHIQYHMVLCMSQQLKVWGCCWVILDS